MSVTAEKCCKGRRRATLPFTGPTAENRSKRIAAARYTKTVLLGKAPADQQRFWKDVSRLGEICFACSIFLDTLWLASFQRHVAMLGLLMNVMLNSAENRLDIFQAQSSLTKCYCKLLLIK